MRRQQSCQREGKVHERPSSVIEAQKGGKKRDLVIRLRGSQKEGVGRPPLRRSLSRRKKTSELFFSVSNLLFFVGDGGGGGGGSVLFCFCMLRRCNAASTSDAPFTLFFFPEASLFFFFFFQVRGFDYIRVTDFNETKMKQEKQEKK